MTDEWIERATEPAAFLAGANTVVLLAITGHAPDPAAPRRSRPGTGGALRPRPRLPPPVRIEAAARGARHPGGAGRGGAGDGRLRATAGAAAGGAGGAGLAGEVDDAAGARLRALGCCSGAIATTLTIAPDEPLRKTCGSCTRCIVACPTDAIAPDGGVLDSRLCISYHTIESREPIPQELRAKFGDWIFGCDDCLDSCPVGARGTRPATPTSRPPRADDAFPPLAELLSLDEAAFRERFRGRAVQRATRDGFLRNVCVALGNVGTAGGCGGARGGGRGRGGARARARGLGAGRDCAAARRGRRRGGGGAGGEARGRGGGVGAGGDRGGPSRRLG